MYTKHLLHTLLYTGKSCTRGVSRNEWKHLKSGSCAGLYQTPYERKNHRTWNMQKIRFGSNLCFVLCTKIHTRTPTKTYINIINGSSFTDRSMVDEPVRFDVDWNRLIGIGNDDNRLVDWLKKWLGSEMLYAIWKCFMPICIHCSFVLGSFFLFSLSYSSNIELN